MTDLALPAPVPAERRVPWGVAASVALHLAFAASALLISPLRELVVPPPAPIAVEILTPGELAALEEPSPPIPVVPLPAPVEALAAPQQGDRLTPSGPIEPKLEQGRKVTATDFYAATLLARPDMQRIRQKLTGFAESERMVQICDIEAIEQIKRAATAFDPDTVVPYAMGDPLWNGLTFTASSGAFRSRRGWYELAFHCTVAPGYEAVTAFDFTIGATIPRAEWEEHNLNAADSDND